MNSVFNILSLKSLMALLLGDVQWDIGYLFIHLYMSCFWKAFLCQAWNTKQSASSKLLYNKGDKELTDNSIFSIALFLCHKGLQLVLCTRVTSWSVIGDPRIHLALEMVLTSVNHDYNMQPKEVGAHGSDLRTQINQSLENRECYSWSVLILADLWLLAKGPEIGSNPGDR